MRVSVFVFKFFTSSISNKGALAPDGLGPFFFFFTFNEITNEVNVSMPY